MSGSLNDTLRIAGMVGRRLAGGEVIELVGDLGSGKTVFVRGLAKGVNSKDVVQSPTFTIARQYDGHDGLVINHFDFHRLDNPGIVAEELAEVLTNPKAVVAVEWSDIVKNVLPKGRLVIKLLPTANEHERELAFRATDSKHAKLIVGLK